MSRSRTLAVESARDLGVQLEQNPHRMIGQDGAFSIPLGAGEALWFFGDTLIGTRPPGGQSLWYIDCKPVGHADMTGRGTIERMINNTGLILRDRTGRHGLRDYSYILDDRAQLRALLPLEGHEHPDWDRIWCQHGLALNGRIYLSFIKVRMLADDKGPMPVPFEIVGSGLAVGTRDSWQFRRVLRHGDSILWRAQEPHFATAMLHCKRDGLVYLYGSVRQNEVQNCFVGRVPAAQIEDLGAYEYFAGPSGWTRDLSRARPIFSGMPSELSVSYNRHLGCYLAVHSLNLTGQIVGRTAPDPWGPWSEPIVLWTVHLKPRPAPSASFPYAGKEHPELAEQDGRVIYLTYIEFEEYYPHLVEVTLA